MNVSLALAFALAAAPLARANAADPAAVAAAEPRAGDVAATAEREDDVASRSVFGARVGSLYALRRVGTRGDAAAPGVGVFWLLDAQVVLAEVAVDLYSGDDNHLFAGGVGAYYPIVRSDFTPYVGGNVRYALTTFGGQGANGFQVVPALGVLYARLSGIQLRAELGWFLNLFRERLGEVAARTPGATSGRSVVAQGPVVALGAAF